MLSTLSSKGQITLPKDLRDLLKLHAGDKIEFLFRENGRVEMIALTSSVKNLKGAVPKSTRKVSLDDMDKAIRKKASKQ